MNYITFFSFLNFLFYCVTYGLSKSVFWANVSLGKSRRRWVVFFSILFCLIPFWGGDYFHYMEIFPMLKQGWYQLNVEKIYETFARYSPDYHFFRFIIWGTAFWLVCKCIRILHLNFDLSIFFFTSLFLYKFSYARVSLCMAIMYLGLAVMSKNKLKEFIIGLTLVISSFYFHKSSLFGIAIIIASFAISNMTKRTIFCLFILFPIFVVLVQVLIGDYLSMNIERGSMNMGAGQTYMTNENVAIGIGEYIMNILWRSMIYLIAYLYIKIIYDGNYVQLPRRIKYFANASFLTIYASSIFAFNLGINTTVIYNRFLNFCMLPSVFFLSSCYANRIHKQLIKIIVYVGSAAAVYTLLYSTYLNDDNAAKYMLILNAYLK